MVALRSIQETSFIQQRLCMLVEQAQRADGRPDAASPIALLPLPLLL
jgi:hypothetical protein